MIIANALQYIEFQMNSHALYVSIFSKYIFQYLLIVNMFLILSLTQEILFAHASLKWSKKPYILCRAIFAFYLHISNVFLWHNDPNAIYIHVLLSASSKTIDWYSKRIYKTNIWEFGLSWDILGTQHRSITHYKIWNMTIIKRNRKWDDRMNKNQNCKASPIYQRQILLCTNNKN